MAHATTTPMVAPGYLRSFIALDRRIWLLAAVRAANTVGLSLVLTFFGIYIVTERGKSGLFYGILMLIAHLFQSLAQAYAGEISDRVGRIRIMATSLWVRSVVLAALGLMILEEASIPWLIGPIILSNILRGFFEPTSYALVSDLASEDQKVFAFALQRMGTNLGWAIGPVSGGLLSEVVPFGTIFFLSAPVLLASGLLVARMREAPARVRLHTDRTGDGVLAAWRQTARDRTALGFLVCAALFTVGHGQIFTTLSIFMKGTLGLSKANVGQVFLVNAILVLLLQMVVVSWIQRAGYRRALVLGSATLTVALAVCGILSTTAGLAGVMALYTLGEVLVAPSQQALAADLAQGGRTGRAFGLLGQAQMLGVALAPLVGGAAYDVLADTPIALWLVLSIFPLAMTLGYRHLARSA